MGLGFLGLPTVEYDFSQYFPFKNRRLEDFFQFFQESLNAEERSFYERALALLFF